VLGCGASFSPSGVTSRVSPESTSLLFQLQQHQRVVIVVAAIISPLVLLDEDGRLL